MESKTRLLQGGWNLNLYRLATLDQIATERWVFFKSFFLNDADIPILFVI